jgi:hypothetical protein
MVCFYSDDDKLKWFRRLFLPQYVFKIFLQWRNIVLNGLPEQFIIQAIITVDDAVPNADNPA